MQQGTWLHEKTNSFGEYTALIHSEVSEAFEDHRAGEPETKIWFLDKKTGERFTRQLYVQGKPALKPCGIPIEMADVIIRVLDFCGAHGIDIENAVRMKYEYNLTREYKHGKVL